MWLTFGGIPQKSLPLRGWPQFGIPGAYESPGEYKYEELYPLKNLKRIRELKEETEIMEIISILMSSGVLN